MNTKVLSKFDAEEIYSEGNYNHLISIRGPTDKLFAYFDDNKNYLELIFDDIEYSSHVYQKATLEDIDKLFNYLKNVNANDNILIHCAAGISRSPAICLLLWAFVLGDNNEYEAVDKMKKSCYEFISPNLRIVILGDHYLKRNGKLIKAYADVFNYRKERVDGLLKEMEDDLI